jgi:hypothetical protein
MTTTDRRGLSGVEWRLLLVAALGAVYAASFLGLAEPRPKPAPRTATLGKERRVAALRPPAATRSPRIRTRSS